MVFAKGERIIIVAKRHLNYSLFTIHYSLFSIHSPRSPVYCIFSLKTGKISQVNEKTEGRLWD